MKTIIKEFRSQYLILLLTIAVFIIAGAALIVLASMRRNSLEYPVQWDQSADAVYFSTTRMIAKYTPDGDLVWRLTKAGKNRPLSGRLDYTFGPDGNIYLANTDARTIEVISPDGEWQSDIGNGAVSDMFTIAFLKDGRLAAADTNNGSLLIFTADGTLETTLGGTAGASAEQFNMPSGIAQFPDGLIHVVDTRNQRMQRIDLQNIFREAWNLGLAGNQVPERGGMIRNIKNRIFKGEFLPARTVFDPVRDHAHICYVNSLEYPAPEAFIIRMDTSGQPVQTVQLLSPEGKPLNVQRMRRALEDNIAVVDPGAYMAGLWNPAENSYEPISNSGVNIELERMLGMSQTVRTFRGIGVFLVFLGFAGVAASAFLVFKEYQAWREKALAGRHPKPPQGNHNLSR